MVGSAIASFFGGWDAGLTTLLIFMGLDYISGLIVEMCIRDRTNTGEMYVLYDDFGKLTLKSLSSMYVGVPGAYLMIDEETGQDFEYTSSIDSNTYNKIKLTYDNEDTKKRDVYITQDSSNINKWGILQYFDTLQKGENGQAKADALLKLYNKKTRNLKITNALGDNRVRAGSMVVINLDLGDMKVKNWMLVEKCSHISKEGEH